MGITTTLKNQPEKREWFLFIFYFGFFGRTISASKRTCHQTGKENTPFSLPAEICTCLPQFHYEKNSIFLCFFKQFLFEISINPYLKSTVLFYSFSWSLNSKKPPQLPLIRRSNHISLHIYCLFGTKRRRPYFHFCRVSVFEIAFAGSIMRIRLWVLVVLTIYGFVGRISADQNARTERISGNFLALAVAEYLKLNSKRSLGAQFMHLLLWSMWGLCLSWHWVLGIRSGVCFFFF